MAVLAAIPAHDARTEVGQRDDGSRAHVLHRGHVAGKFPVVIRSSSMIPPVLCYHRIGGPPELGVTRVAHSVFARQMQALARSGWRTVPLREFVTRVQNSRKDRKSTRLNSSHSQISYAVFCLKKKNIKLMYTRT